MKLIRIGASWCSSCLIMKSRVSDILSNRDDIEVINYDYDFDEDKVEEYQVGDILPVYIKEDGTRLIGEHSKEEFIKFIES